MLEVALDRVLPARAEEDFVLLLLDAPEWFSSGRPTRRTDRRGEIQLYFEWTAVRVAVVSGCHLICPYFQVPPHAWAPIRLVSGDSIIVRYVLTYPAG